MRNLLLKISISLLVGWVSAQPLFSQTYSTGLNFDDEEYASAPMKAPLTRGLYVEEVPASVSLKKYCPTPMSQGDYGTCVGWCTNWAARTIVEAIHADWNDQSYITSNTFSPGYVYQQIKDKNDANCQFGSSLYDALNFMKYKGTVKYSDFEDQCTDRVDPSLLDRASQHKIKDFARLFGQDKSNEFKIQAVKKSLSEYNPVVMGMKCPPSFYNAKGVWEPTESGEENFGGHAMCVIGYDDNRYGGAFEIMNSWGTRWGNDGFIWVKYEDFASFTKYAYEVFSDPAPKPPSVPDLSGRIKLLTDRGEEMGANLLGQSYASEQAWPSGTSFRIYISNNEPAYVYAIGSDRTEEIFQLFPYAPDISAALNYKQNNVALPSEDHYITMDNTTGTDYLCVLYSKEELDIESIKSRLSYTSGNLQDRIKKVLGDLLVDPANINYHQQDIGFTAFSKGGKVVALILATEHI